MRISDWSSDVCSSDLAPVSMVETVIRLKPRDEWRPGVTLEGLKAELDRIVRIPGMPNTWTMPIKNRIDMLATGVKTPVGVKVSGPDLAVIDHVAKAVEAAVRDVPGKNGRGSGRESGWQSV